MKKLDLYILKKFLGTYFFIVILLIVIVIVFDLVEKIDHLMESEATTKQIVVDYYLNLVPYYANMLSPLLVFISVIFFTSKLAGQTEIVAILSSGVSFKRMMVPYFWGAAIIAVLTYILGSHVIPVANRTRIDFENTYIRIHKDVGLSDVHMQIGPETYIYLKSFRSTQGNKSSKESGRHFDLETFEGKKLKSRLSARTITYNEETGKWHLNDYTQWTFDEDGISHVVSRGEEMDSTINIYPSDFKKERKSFEMMTNEELSDHIGDMKRRGLSGSGDFEIELYKRDASPFAAFILTLIGVSLSSRKTRGGMGMHIGIGLGLAFIYILFLTISTSFASNSGMNAIFAVWLPNIVFSIIGIILYYRAPK